MIKVGAQTETELKEKKFRIDDAVAATRAALEEGIVAGGGVALFDVLKDFNKKAAEPAKTNMILDDFSKGSAIIKSILALPIRAIAENSGENPDRVVREIIKKELGWGYNASNGEYGDMFEMGIIDPLKVVKVALVNAVSVASTILTTEAIITDAPEEKKFANRRNAPNGRNGRRVLIPAPPQHLISARFDCASGFIKAQPQPILGHGINSC